MALLNNGLNNGTLENVASTPSRSLLLAALAALSCAWTVVLILR